MGRNIGGSDGSQQTLPVRSFHLLDRDVRRVSDGSLRLDKKGIEARTICPVSLHLSHVTLAFIVSCPRSYSAEANGCTVCCMAVDCGPQFPALLGRFAVYCRQALSDSAHTATLSFTVL